MSQRAGPELLAERRTLGGGTGEAKLTHGYPLPARFVIHPLGPVRGNADEDNLPVSCYRSVFGVAAESDVRSLASLAASTSVCGFLARAARELWTDSWSTLG